MTERLIAPPRKIPLDQFDPDLVKVIGVQSSWEENKPEWFGYYAVYYHGLEQIHIVDIKNPSTTRWTIPHQQLIDRVKQIITIAE